MTKIYKEFLITADPLNSEIISSVLWELNIDGISEEVNCIKVFTSDSNLNQRKIEDVLQKLRMNSLIREFAVQENVIVEKNWNEEWEKSREVIHITDRIVIKPTFRQYEPKENELVITLDPKMSFGTGDHPTTKICINLLEKYIQPGIKVLDLGSGTGILSIVAAKLGVSKVIAIDIDEWSLLNGTENVKLNSVENIIEVRLCELKDVPEKDFQLIVANIQRNVLSELSSDIVYKLAENGTLILSGLLDGDYQIIKDTYSQFRLIVIDFLQMDEWIGVVFRKQ